MGACDSKTHEMEVEGGEPEMHYFSFAGRGEIARICAVAGGVNLKEVALTMEGDRKALCEECGCVGTGIPVLKHGNLKMCQSVAIQNYLCHIAPQFKGMPARARAIDSMWFSNTEDYIIDVLVNNGLMDEMYGWPPIKAVQLYELTCAMTKWWGYFEKQAAKAGGRFINGLDYPTGADACLLVMYKAAVPYSAMWAKCTMKPSCPNVKKLVEKIEAYPQIKEYLARTETFTMNPFA